MKDDKQKIVFETSFCLSQFLEFQRSCHERRAHPYHENYMDFM